MSERERYDPESGETLEDFKIRTKPNNNFFVWNEEENYWMHRNKLPEIHKKLSDTRKRIAQERIALYGSAVPVRDKETGELMNYSKTSQGHPVMVQIARNKISKYGHVCPVKDESGNLVHYRQTEEGRRTSFATKSSNYELNYRQTDEGKENSHRTVVDRNDILKHNSVEEDLYIVTAYLKDEVVPYFKVGRSADFINKRIYAYLRCPLLRIKKIEVFHGYDTATLEYWFHGLYHDVYGAFEFLYLGWGIGNSEWYTYNFYEEAKDILENDWNCEFKEINFEPLLQRLDKAE